MRISDWSSDVCSSDLVKLVVAIVPAKARVYPEHLRGRKPPQLHEDLYARAEAVLKRDGIAHADLLAPLVDGKADGATFLRTDTHWRSEEHTSELQSLMRISYAVFCLKKKKRKRER